MRGDGNVYEWDGRFFVQFNVAGRTYRKAGFRSRAAAKTYLRDRLARARLGQFVGPVEEKLTVSQLLDSYETSLKIRGSRSIGSFVSHVARIRETFGSTRAMALTATALEEFIHTLQQEGLANATINRGLQALRAAYRLALRQRRLSQMPYFHLLKEENTRQGFFEAKEFEVVVANLPDPIADAARFAYLSGWRKSEVTGLTWERIDRQAREVRLATSKNGQGRVLPLVGSLWELVEKRWAAREFESAGVTRLSAYVFHEHGRSLGDFRKAWQKACVAAGVGQYVKDERGRIRGYVGKLFHDLRRTAARDLVRSGVPETVAMSITGHKTRAVFDRYNITSSKDQREALERIEAHRATLATTRNVAPLLRD